MNTTNTRDDELNVSWDEIRKDLRREGMLTSVGLQQVLLQGKLRHILEKKKGGYGSPSEEEKLNENSAAREMSGKLAANSIDRVVRRLIKTEQRQEIINRRRSSTATGSAMSTSYPSSASLTSLLSSHKSNARDRTHSIGNASCGAASRKPSLGPLGSCISISLPSKPNYTGLSRNASGGSGANMARSTSIGSVTELFTSSFTGGKKHSGDANNASWRLDSSMHDNESMNSSHHKNIYTEIDEMEESFSNLSASRSNKITSMLERASNNLCKELREEDESF